MERSILRFSPLFIKKNILSEILAREYLVSYRLSIALPVHVGISALDIVTERLAIEVKILNAKKLEYTIIRITLHSYSLTCRVIKHIERNGEQTFFPCGSLFHIPLAGIKIAGHVHRVKSDKFFQKPQRFRDRAIWLLPRAATWGIILPGRVNSDTVFKPEK